MFVSEEEKEDLYQSRRGMSLFPLSEFNEGRSVPRGAEKWKVWDTNRIKLVELFFGDAWNHLASTILKYDTQSDASNLSH